MLRPVWYQALYTSATVTGNGSSGITSTGPTGIVPARFPILFHLLGENITTDETLDVTIQWFDNVTAGILGTTTFDQLTASTLRDYEGWPGDVTVFNAGRDLIPLPPYMNVTWTLAGTTKSMNFIVYMDYLTY